MFDFTTILVPFCDVMKLLRKSKQVATSTALLLVRAALETTKEHEECLQEGRLFSHGIILDYMQRNCIITAYMTMREKLVSMRNCCKAAMQC